MIHDFQCACKKCAPHMYKNNNQDDLREEILKTIKTLDKADNPYLSMPPREVIILLKQIYDVGLPKRNLADEIAAKHIGAKYWESWDNWKKDAVLKAMEEYKKETSISHT